MATKLLTVTGYSKRIKRGRARVSRWLDAAASGDALPGDGVVVVDPEGRKWIEVTEATADTEPAR